MKNTVNHTEPSKAEEDTDSHYKEPNHNLRRLVICLNTEIAIAVISAVEITIKQWPNGSVSPNTVNTNRNVNRSDNRSRFYISSGYHII